jgi:hypothetical protein
MPLNLAAPLAWTNLAVDQAAALKNLQGNILKGHGRQHTPNLLFQFTATDAPAVRAFLKTLPVTNAFAQLSDADAVRSARSSGKKVPKTLPFVALMLSNTGYRKLGVGAARTPADPRFRAGIKASRRGILLRTQSGLHRGVVATS